MVMFMQEIEPRLEKSKCSVDNSLTMTNGQERINKSLFFIISFVINIVITFKLSFS